MGNEELSPCLWCEDGGSPHVVSGYQEDEGRRSWVACRTCGAGGPIATSKPNALAAWNRRSLAAQAQADVTVSTVEPNGVLVASIEPETGEPGSEEEADHA